MPDQTKTPDAARGLFVAVRERYCPFFRVTWYNRDGRFSNGVKWFRFQGWFLWGWGLWWKDTRVEPLDVKEDAPDHRLWTFGPFVVALLWPRSA